jgi:hypothetical protein
MPWWAKQAHETRKIRIEVLAETGMHGCMDADPPPSLMLLLTWYLTSYYPGKARNVSDFNRDHFTH